MTNLPAPQDGQHPSSDGTVVLAEADRCAALTSAEQILPLAEETATVEKRAIVTGKMQVRTITETLEELTKADLQSKTVEVTRVPMGIPGDGDHGFQCIVITHARPSQPDLITHRLAA